MNRFCANVRSQDCNTELLTFCTSRLTAADQSAVEVERSQYQHWLTLTQPVEGSQLEELELPHVNATINLIRAEYVLECYLKYAQGRITRKRLLCLLHRNLLIRADMDALFKEREKKKRECRKRKRELLNTTVTDVHELDLLNWHSPCGLDQFMQLVTPSKLLELRHQTACLLQDATQEGESVAATKYLRNLHFLDKLHTKYNKRIGK